MRSIRALCAFALLAALAAPSPARADERADAYRVPPSHRTPPPEMRGNDDLVRPALPGKAIPTDPRDGIRPEHGRTLSELTPEMEEALQKAMRKAPPQLGGDDVNVRPILYYESVRMDVAEDGTIIVACDQNPSEPFSEHILFYRSTDGGTTFDYWGQISSAGNDYDRLYDLDVVNGVVDRVYVTYMHRNSSRGAFDVRIAYADPAASFASWTIRTVMDEPGVSFLGPDTCTDVVAFSDFYMYTVCAGLDGNGDDVWYSRSIDHGNTWSAPYRIGTLSSNGNLMYTRPVIEYGAGGVLHVAYTYTERLQSTFDDAVRYKRATNYGSASSDWEVSTWHLSSTGNGRDDYAVKVMAPPTGNTVAVLDLQWASSGQSSVYADYNGGTTWAVANFHDLPVYGWLDWCWDPASSRFLLAGNSEGGPLAVYEATVGDLSSWLLRGSYSDEDIDAFALPQIAVDPTRGNRVALAWQGYDAGGAAALFDAAWRQDPGFPNYDEGFPVEIPGVSGGLDLSRTPPAIVNVDADPYDEIVFGNADGLVYVVSHLGTIPGGWPRNVGGMPLRGHVAVGDLNGDGEMEIVAGNNDGLIYCFDSQGNVQPGFPVDLGTADAVYLSIGAVGPPYPRWIVAVSGTKVCRVSYRGEVQFKSGFLNGEYIYPPAIGDLDGDGDSEIVVNFRPASGTGSGLHVYAGDFVGGTQYRGFSETASGAVTLGDLDLDGDLEICYPTYDKVYAVHHDFTDVTGFPYSHPGSTGFTAVALDQVLGNSPPELIVNSVNGLTHVVYSTGVAQSNYPATLDPSWFLYGSPIVTSVLDFNTWMVSGSRDERAHAFRNVGASLPAGWPKDLGDKIEVSAAAADIDRDGRNEIVFLGRNALHVVDVGTPSGQSGLESWRMAQQNPARTGCMDCVEDVATAVGDDLPTRVGFRLASVNPAPGPVSFAATLPGPGIVELGIYDVRGRRVRLVTRQEATAGVHTLHFDGRDQQGAKLARGAYFARLNVQGNGFAEKATRKFLLID